MAKYIIRDATVTVNGVDFTNHISSVTIDQSADDVDLTAMGSANREHAVGIPDASIMLSFWQDFAAGSVDVTLQAIYDAKTAVPIVVRPTAAAVSATNPKRTMQGVLMNYNPLAGGVGDASATEVTFNNGDPSGIVRATV